MVRSFLGKYGLRAAVLSSVAIGLVACEEGEGFQLLKKKEGGATQEADTPEESGPQQFIEKDVEAPEVFSETDKALWDGRPSLGGVWVAHTDVNDPERVVIRNAANGRKVIGALFRRERDSAGPALQLSSDAAEALGVVAGVPVELSVVAMRKKKIPIGQPEPTEPVKAADAPEDVVASSLEPQRAPDDGLTPAPAAPKPAASKPVATPAASTSAAAATRPMIKPLPRPNKPLRTAAAPKPAPAAPASKPASPGSKRYIQMGFFSVQSNAEKTLSRLQSQGIQGKIIASESNGTKFWRVLAGPTSTSDGAESILARVKALGFSDAFIVKG